MSKITKQLAKEIATTICRKAFDLKIKSVDAENSEYCAVIAENSVNPEVVKFYKKFPGFVSTRSYYNFFFGGLEHIGMYTKRNIPCKEGYDNKSISVSREEYETIRAGNEKLKQLRGDMDLLFAQIESTLISLGTFKRVEEQFPEAAIYLPTDESRMTTTISLPIKDIRTLLNKYNQENQ